MNKKINIVSTALVADWSLKGSLICTPLSADEFVAIVGNAKELENFCGHPETTKTLNDSGIKIPAQTMRLDSEGNSILHPKFKTPMGDFWDGKGIAVAARPRGGVRNTSVEGDTKINSLDNLEFLMFEFSQK